MKRRLSSAAPEPGGTPRRRQPQTSCDFCRLKKLKCDRGEPCSNCLARRLTCLTEGQPPPQKVVSSQSTGDILHRLYRLETVVFGETQQDGDASVVTPSPNPVGLNHHGGEAVPAADPIPRPPPSPGQRDRLRRHRQVSLAQELDYMHTDTLAADDSDRIVFRIAPTRASASRLGLDGTPLDEGPTTGNSPAVVDALGVESAPLYVWIPSKYDALALQQRFANDDDGSHWQIMRIVPTVPTRAMIMDTYARLSRGQSVGLGRVALVLAICAAGAYFWDERHSYASSQSQPVFLTEAEAMRQSFAWRRSAWCLLDQAQRTASWALEDVQARIVLSDIVHNMEGSSPRYRYLQNNAAMVARGLSLHWVDAPGANQDGHDDAATRELKRRVWWYLCSTDWLLGFMGGPYDRTYNINPKHMKVRFPRDMNDSDLDNCGEDYVPPATGPTDMSFFLQRVRLGEIYREVVDRLPAGSDIDDLPYEQIASLERFFDYSFAGVPSYCALDAPLPPSAPPRFDLQRQVMHLAYHARRARLYRPFLQPGSIKADPRKLFFRDACLQSAASVLNIASSLLEEELETPLPPPPLPQLNNLMASSTTTTTSPPKVGRTLKASRRTGIIISHLFMACAVLAADPSINVNVDGPPNSVGPNGSAPQVLDPDAESRRVALVKACVLLEKAGEESTLASGLLRRLTRVFKRHRMPSVSDRNSNGNGPPMLHFAPGDSSSIQQLISLEPRPDDDDDDAAAAAAAAGLPAPGFGMLVDGQQPADANWAYYTPDALGVTGIWNDFMNTVPLSDRWGQIFLDLETFGGPV